MLRIKRSVQAQYNTDAGYVAAAQAVSARTENGGEIDESGDPMADLERQAAPLEGFVQASTGPVGGGAS
jgi:pre-mRNA-splicing factor SYF1